MVIFHCYVSSPEGIPMIYHHSCWLYTLVVIYVYNNRFKVIYSTLCHHLYGYYLYGCYIYIYINIHMLIIYMDITYPTIHKYIYIYTYPTICHYISPLKWLLSMWWLYKYNMLIIYMDITYPTLYIYIIRGAVTIYIYIYPIIWHYISPFKHKSNVFIWNCYYIYIYILYLSLYMTI